VQRKFKTIYANFPFFLIKFKNNNS